MKKKYHVPLVKQFSQTECGLCCCLMLLKYYKSRETFKQLQDDVDVGRDGLSIGQMKDILTSRGMEASAYKVKNIEGLKAIKTPFIAYWQEKHFIVVEKIKKHKYYVKDPAEGSFIIPENKFIESFSGYVLTASPALDYIVKKTKSQNPWRDAFQSLMKHKKLVIEIFLFLILSYLMGLFMPVLIEKIIDKALVSDAISALNAFYLLILALLATYVVVSLFKSFRLTRLNIVVGYRLEADTYKHLLSLPYKFFEQRTTGDLLYKLSSTSAVKELIATQLIAGVIDIGTLIITFIYMFHKSVLLSVAALVFFTLNVLITVYLQPFITRAVKDEVNARTRMQSSQVESMYSIQSIKLASIENIIYDVWNKEYEKSVTAFRRKIIISSIQSCANSTMSMFVPIGILLLGIWNYFNGMFSLGEAVAFESICVSFMSYTSEILSTYMQFVTTDEYLQRIGDIWYSRPEVHNVKHHFPIAKGEIKIENVSFSYNKSAMNVLRDINIDIPAGSRVAFVGASGSGKSTLSKLITGLYQPTEGKIYYDGIPLEDYDRQMIRNQIGIVPQDAMLFNKTIYENITMNSSDADLERVKECCRYACIDKEIEQMPMGYNTIISEMGLNLSGGQRQRILLARALLNHPKVIVLDEATSSLDNRNEERITEYLRKNGCTQIVIAHRLSTVIDADSIYVFDKGTLIECGTHADLMKQKGDYYKLYQRAC